MRLELHCHSTHSDGSFSAGEVASRAAAFGVRLFALTDHDTFAGYEETRTVLAAHGTVVLRALELSCKAYGRTVHLLMYGLEEGPGLEALQQRLESVGCQRRERLRAIIERLRKLGIELDADAILVRTHGKIAGRPDVARALVEARVCSSPREAFTRFLHDGGPADVPVDRVSVSEGLALGRAAGARMSLAHPNTLGDHAIVRDLFVRLRSEGLEGIEAYYGKHSRAEMEIWLSLARTLDLVPTGGSDFHGEMSPDVTRPGIELALPAAQRIAAWLGHALA